MSGFAMYGEAMSSPKVKVTDRLGKDGHGYALFHLDSPKATPIHLSDAFARWMEAKENLTVRAICPIVMSGQTALIHLWYEIVAKPSQKNGHN